MLQIPRGGVSSEVRGVFCGTTGVRPLAQQAPTRPARSKSQPAFDVAAPGDGRTPVQAGLDAGVTRKMCPKQHHPLLDSHSAVAAITILLMSRS